MRFIIFLPSIGDIEFMDWDDNPRRIFVLVRQIVNSIRPKRICSRRKHREAKFFGEATDPARRYGVSGRRGAVSEHR
jgi:hypothetical protein